MEKLKFVVLGDGLLGSEIVRQLKCNYISRKKDNFDIKKKETYDFFFSEYQVIINCIANTDTYSIERDKHWETNFEFVYNLINYCNSKNKKLVHISTDYLYTFSVKNASETDVPVHCANWYGYTKLLSDGIVQLISDNFLLIRCSHKPSPFPYQKAWKDVIGNFDYVDRIAERIIKLIKRNRTGLFNVGTHRKTIYDLAKETNPNVEAINSPEYVPKDVSINIEKLKKG